MKKIECAYEASLPLQFKVCKFLKNMKTMIYYLKIWVTM